MLDKTVERKYKIQVICKKPSQNITKYFFFKSLKNFFDNYNCQTLFCKPSAFLIMEKFDLKKKLWQSNVLYSYKSFY